jgi:hypothetical protein
MKKFRKKPWINLTLHVKIGIIILAVSNFNRKEQKNHDEVNRNCTKGR